MISSSCYHQSSVLLPRCSVYYTLANICCQQRTQSEAECRLFSIDSQLANLVSGLYERQYVSLQTNTKGDVYVNCRGSQPTSGHFLKKFLDLSKTFQVCARETDFLNLPDISKGSGNY